MNNYTGNKDFSNVIHFLINRLPKSKRYFSLFFGGGGLENSIYTADAYFICAEKNPDCKKYEVSRLSSIEYSDYKYLLDENVFTEEDFVFADPPYMFSSRASGKRYYKFEFSTEDHIEFLNRIKNIKAKTIITHPECDLYDKHLKGWNKETFTYMTRNGNFKDCVYMNFSTSGIELLNYDCLGTDFIDRQRIKRQRKNIINKFKRLDPLVLKAIIRDMKKENILDPQ